MDTHLTPTQRQELDQATEGLFLNAAGEVVAGLVCLLSLVWGFQSFLQGERSYLPVAVSVVSILLGQMHRREVRSIEARVRQLTHQWAVEREERLRAFRET